MLLIDCEGCEWAALEQMSRDPASLRLLRHVKLLYLDAHITPTLSRQGLHKPIVALCTACTARVNP